MKKTVTIQAGNTDNKLTQQRWSCFVHDLQCHIPGYVTVHFFGGATTWEPWQNVCWCGEIEVHQIPALTRIIKDIREAYNQDSVAVTIGETLFV